MNQDEKNNIEKSEEYENFEKLAKELLNLPPEDIKKILEDEKSQGIQESENDQTENESN